MTGAEKCASGVNSEMHARTENGASRRLRLQCVPGLSPSNFLVFSAQCYCAYFFCAIKVNETKLRPLIQFVKCSNQVVVKKENETVLRPQ